MDNNLLPEIGRSRYSYVTFLDNGLYRYLELSLSCLLSKLPILKPINGSMNA